MSINITLTETNNSKTPTDSTEQDLLNVINTQAVLIDAQSKQIALAQAICDQFGDHIPALYQLLSSLEGDQTVERQLQNDCIAILEAYLASKCSEYANQRD